MHKIGSIEVNSLANSVSFDNLKTDGFELKSDLLTFSNDAKPRHVDINVTYLNLDTQKSYSLSSPIKLKPVSNYTYKLSVVHKPMSYFQDRDIITGISIWSTDKFIGNIECYGDWLTQ